MPLQGLWSILRIIQLVLTLLVCIHVSLRLLHLILLLLLLLTHLVVLLVLLIIALLRRLVVQSTFRFYPINTALITHHTVALLFVCRNGRIWARFIHTTVRYYTLDFHHWVEFLSRLLELFLRCRVVRVGAHRAHSVSASLLSNNLTESSNNTSLVFNFYVDRIVGVYWASVRHWSLRARSTLNSWLASETAHLSSWLENLLAASATSIHSVVHHASLIQLTIRLSVKGIVLIVLSINTLRSTRSLKVLTLGTITIARPLIRNNTTTNHPEGTTVLTLPRNLL